MSRNDFDDLQVFEQLRPDLIALAYRMLGDVARAQDLVQETWLRWHARKTDVETPRPYLLSIVTRLCLTELERHREDRGDRLPEPVDVSLGGMEGIERLDQLSMAFLVLLERLSAPERAVLLLHDVYELPHAEIARLLDRTSSSCRKLLERAREHVAEGRKRLTASREDHSRLLTSFLEALQSGDVAKIIAVLADDAVLFTDGGVEGRSLGSLRNLKAPLQGSARIAHFILAANRATGLVPVRCELNGQPAVLFRSGGRPYAALMLGVAEGRVERLFFHADAQRLRFVD